MTAAPSKTLLDFFKPPPAKRLKRVSSPPPGCGFTTTTTAISPEQERRMEYHKALAVSKRNRTLCEEKVSKAIASSGVGAAYVKLEELLVEETWSDAIADEFEKPYAIKLSEFLEDEILRGDVPVYPPQHLFFNALNATPFNRVKAAIIGQ
ncbi:hypothetical protein M569_15577, partial [Genlisea aurea]